MAYTGVGLGVSKQTGGRARWGRGLDGGELIYLDWFSITFTDQYKVLNIVRWILFPLTAQVIL